MSLDSLRAAKTLAGEGRLRSAISRSYYAAYYAVTGELAAKGVTFARGWNNPAHEQLPDLVSHNLPLSLERRRRLRKALRILRRAREDADYRPGISVDRQATLDYLRAAILVMDALGVRDE
jgi:uncharacterized protein (UPF0332 family)